MISHKLKDLGMFYIPINGSTPELITLIGLY